MFGRFVRNLTSYLTRQLRADNTNSLRNLLIGLALVAGIGAFGSYVGRWWWVFPASSFGSVGEWMSGLGTVAVIYGLHVERAARARDERVERYRERDAEIRTAAKAVVDKLESGSAGPDSELRLLSKHLKEPAFDDAATLLNDIDIYNNLAKQVSGGLVFDPAPIRKALIDSASPLATYVVGASVDVAQLRATLDSEHPQVARHQKLVRLYRAYLNLFQMVKIGVTTVRQNELDSGIAKVADEAQKLALSGSDPVETAVKDLESLLATNHDNLSLKRENLQTSLPSRLAAIARAWVNQ